MSTISFTGLSSGIDTESLIQQLLNVERLPITRLQREQTKAAQKQDLFETFNNEHLAALKSSAETLTKESTFSAFQASTPENDVLTVAVSSDASVGTYTVEVTQIAKAEQLSGGAFTSKTTALGLSGDLLVNGTVISLSSTDTLEGVRDKINAANADATASILSVSSTDHRLALSANATGKEGVEITDGDSGNLLLGLGFTDGTTSIKNSITNGAESDEFSSSTNAIDALLKLNSPQSGVIEINGDMVNTVAIDLSADSLDDIKDAINAAGISGVTASVIEVTDSEGVSTFKLSIDGATSFTDDDNILQTLGVLEEDMDDVAEILMGSVQNTAGGGNITSATLFTAIDGVTDPTGMTIAISGTKNDGTSVSGTYNYVGGDDVQDFLDEIETVLGLGAGSATIEDGKVVVTDDTAGESSLSVSLTASGLTGTLDFGHVDEVRAGSEVNTAAAVNITESTDFTLIDGATATDATSKVAISGLTHNGGSVSGTYTYATGDTVQEFLDEIESVFSLTAGSATIKDGRLFVTDDTEGTSFLSITLVESDFGDLDFGAVSVEKGRERQLQAGQDATLKVNNISISNSSNTVTSVIEGVTLNLLDTNANTGDSPVTISVDRNNSAIESTLQTFVDNYNAVRTFINDQFEFDTETSTAGGLLFGDTTLRSIQTQLQRVLSSTVTGLSGDFDNLVELGITADREGLLSINSTTLQAALVESVSEVADVFVGKGTTSDADITFIGFTEDTAAGTYNVNITTAPTQATVAGTVDLEATPLVGGESIKITDTTSSAEETITFSAGDKIGDIVTAINNALGSKVAEVHVFDTAQTGGSGDLTASDTFAQVDGGAGASDNDTITISGTTQNGSSVSSTYTIQTANTLQDFLNAVAGAFNNEVTAELVNGKLQVTENTAGASSLAATITYNGGGTLNFGAKDSAASTEGRNEIAVTASNDGSDQLVLTHDDYGSGSGFTVEEGAGGDLTALGLPNAGGFATITAGLDVAGTINGETATGSGRLLTGDTDNANTDGLRLQVNPSVTGAQGTVTVSLGIGELMDRLMDGLRDTLDGTITNKLEAFDTESDVLQDRISRIEERLARFEARLKSQFLAMEQAMAQIQSQGNFLLSQLGVSG